MADKIAKCKVVCGAQLSQALQDKWCPDCPFNPEKKTTQEGGAK